MTQIEPRDRTAVPRAAARAGSRWLGGLAGRLVVVLALFTTLATVVVVGMVYGRGSGLLLADAEQRLDADARGVVERVGHRVADRASAVTLVPGLDAAQDLAVDDIDKRLSGALTSVAASLGGPDVALALDAQGRVVASSDPALIGRGVVELAWLNGISCAAGGDGGRPTLVGAGPEARLVVTAPVRARSGGRPLGCVAFASRWLPLLRDAAAPVAWEALAVRDARGERVGGGEPDRAGQADLLLGHAVGPADAPLPLAVEVSEARATALAPVRTARRDALALAFVILLVTVPAATVVAMGATRALRALARSALAVDGSGRPVLADPGPGAPVEVRVLHEALDAMLDRQEEARRALAEREVLASLGTMAAGVAHEIRTPLSVVHGSAEMLARDPDDPARRRELAELITRETDRLDRVVATLLTFARPRAPDRQATDLADVCRRALPTLEALAGQRGVRLELRLERAAARVDPEQMQQVVLNITANAINASPPSAAVVVGTRCDDGAAVLEVADRGPGIPAADLPHIWAPFFTTRPSGTGLGLAIVRRIIDAHGGRIEVITAAGSGTTMRVLLEGSGVESA